MSATKIITKIGHSLKKASPVIATVAAAVGVVATAVMVGKETMKVTQLLDEAKKEKGEDLTKMETVKIAAPVYAPAVAVGVASLLCIFGANVHSHRQQASLASAYALASGTLKNYRDKVAELMGKETDEKIVSEIVKETPQKVDLSAPTIFGDCKLCTDEDSNDEKQMFYIMCADRYFESTLARVISAEYHLNRNFMFGGYTTLNDFFDFLGLEKTEDGDSFGWNMCNGDLYWIDFDHIKTKLEDGMECIIIDTPFAPYADYMDE